jgi:hypothetical protein
MRECLRILEEKGFRAKKTMNESRRDKDHKAAAEDVPEEEDDPNAPAAFAVDLGAYKLGKPVVQKGGALVQDSLLKGSLLILFPFTWRAF